MSPSPGSFAAQDHPHPCRPAGEVEQAGDLGESPPSGLTGVLARSSKVTWVAPLCPGNVRAEAGERVCGVRLEACFGAVVGEPNGQVVKAQPQGVERAGDELAGRGVSSVDGGMAGPDHGDDRVVRLLRDDRRPERQAAAVLIRATQWPG